MFPPSLTELANKHGTDKGTRGPTDDWPGHNYADVYEGYFGKLRQQPINLLEIGMGVTGEQWRTTMATGRNASGGASVKTWYEYFPKAKIYGADINPAPYLDNDRIKTFVFDQGNEADLKAFAKSIGNIEFDIIIDDGSHRPDHQQISLGFFFKLLKSGGIYIIEDLLKNGHGDEGLEKFRKQACGEVKNTRSVIKQFRDTGKFAQPNALLDPGYLEANVASIHFHTPQVSNVARNRGGRLQRAIKALKGEMEVPAWAWKDDTEKLCVLFKK